MPLIPEQAEMIATIREMVRFIKRRGWQFPNSSETLLDREYAESNTVG